MSERLSDEQVARIIAWSQRDPSFTQRLALAREVQAWRALVNGEPCLTCERVVVAIREEVEPFTSGSLGEAYKDHEIHRQAVADRVRRKTPCPPDCVDGRIPGVIERLEALHGPMSRSPSIGWAEDLAAVIAELKEALG